MTKYKIFFTGRRLGAIGVTESYVEEVEAEDYVKARLKLYEKFEHISIFAVVRTN